MPSLSAPFRIATIYVATFLTFGIYIPFFPVFLAGRGLDATAIAVIVAAPMALRVATVSFLGTIVDRSTDRRRVLVVYNGIALLAFLLVWPANSPLAMLLAMLATALFWNAVNPTNDAIASVIARREKRDYGRMRVWGSISFVVANVVGGAVLARTSPEAVYWMMLGGFVLQFAAAFLAPHLPPAADAPVTREPFSAGLKLLGGDWRFVGMLLGASMMQGAHALLYGFSSLHWRAQGYSGDAVGLLWALGVAGEVTLFFLGRPLTGPLGARGLLVFGGLAGVIRWSASPLAESLPFWSGLQLLHAFSFAATHLGVMQGIATTAPERHAATAQGLYLAISGLVMTLATLASGPLYQRFGGGGFLGMAVLAAVGTGVVLAAMEPTVRGGRTLQPQRLGGGGSNVEPS
ncbi:MFS transporter [Methyloraptor flagellatus]|uniref:MFS transporter n=1 Tax=Methyloraptor flagellatus TaxID=3162530 RepID=A0AAU7XC74_9HYPH